MISPILYGDYVYLVSDKGIISCLDARTGEVKYEGGRVPVPATFMASPIAYDGKLLLTSIGRRHLRHQGRPGAPGARQQLHRRTGGIDTLNLAGTHPGERRETPVWHQESLTDRNA